MDETLAEVVRLIYGEGAGELISKMNPDQADLATKDKKKRAITAGLSAVGATAGVAGLGYSGYKTAGAYKAAKGATRLKRLRTGIKHEKFGAALVPLEVAGLGGELMATKILHGDTKKKVAKSLTPIGKSIGEIPESASGVPTNRGQLTRMMMTSSARAGGKGLEYSAKGVKKLPEKVTTTKGKLTALKQKLEKRDDVEITWEGEITKADEDKQQIFGWASVINVNGEPVVDLQGDLISEQEMEKSAYEYVVKSRKGGDMHLRDEWQPVQKSDMIESFMVTDEKRAAMGLPTSVPTGWWVGFQVNDQDVWSKVKSGERTGFSIHGRGRRSPA